VPTAATGRALSLDPPIIRGCLGVVGRARVDRPRIHVVNHLGRRPIGYGEGERSGDEASGRGRDGEAPRESVDSGYAIRDGHHRVSVARARGALTIDATVEAPRPLG
jgi:hypothetical protein